MAATTNQTKKQLGSADTALYLVPGGDPSLLNKSLMPDGWQAFRSRSSQAKDQEHAITTLARCESPTEAVVA